MLQCQVDSEIPQNRVEGRSALLVQHSYKYSTQITLNHLISTRWKKPTTVCPLPVS